MPERFVSAITTPMDVVEVSPPPSTEPTIMQQQPTEAEPPLEVWSQVNGMPYTAKHFDVNVWNSHAERSVRAIEGFVMDEITKKGLDPTIDSYHEIMRGIDGFLALSPNTAKNVRFDKVVDYVNLFTKYNRIEQKKKKLIAQVNQLREIEYG